MNKKQLTMIATRLNSYCKGDHTDLMHMAFFSNFYFTIPYKDKVRIINKAQDIRIISTITNAIRHEQSRKQRQRG